MLILTQFDAISPINNEMDIRQWLTGELQAKAEESEDCQWKQMPRLNNELNARWTILLRTDGARWRWSVEATVTLVCGYYWPFQMT